MSEQKLVLKKVTPKALKIYKKNGLLDFKSDDVVIAEKTFDVFCDEKALAEVLEVSFVKNFKDVDIEDVDLALISEGIQSFLGQLSANLLK